MQKNINIRVTFNNLWDIISSHKELRFRIFFLDKIDPMRKKFILKHKSNSIGQTLFYGHFKLLSMKDYWKKKVLNSLIFKCLKICYKKEY